MVCVRCKMAVQTVLENLKIPYIGIELGRIELKDRFAVRTIRCA